MSPEDIKKGREAYQRIKWDQFGLKTNWFAYAFPLLLFGVKLLIAYSGGKKKEAFLILLLLVCLLFGGIVSDRYRKQRHREALALLKELQLRNGRESCEILRKEPATWYYFLFQRRFPRFREETQKYNDPLSN